MHLNVCRDLIRNRRDFGKLDFSWDSVERMGLKTQDTPKLALKKPSFLPFSSLCVLCELGAFAVKNSFATEQ